MLSKINNSYFQFYTGIIIGSSLLDLGCRIYSSKTHKHEHQTKLGLAISRTLQNTSFVMPIIWIGCKLWRSTYIANLNAFDVNDSVALRVLTAASIALPFGRASYEILTWGFNPIFALETPEDPEELTITEYVTNSVCNVFRVLNITAVSISLRSGKISLPSALITISACLVTMVAQGHLFERP